MRLPSIHPQLINIHRILDACSFEYTPPIEQPESKEYGACSFMVNNKNVQFRVAKITPTKVGLFVVLWKRSQQGPIEPYDTLDGVDIVIISVQNGNRQGQFVFPQSVLKEKSIFSTNGIGGKRGIRVYPSWCTPTSAQAIKTQKWQCKYFLEISTNKSLNIEQTVHLYTNT